MSRDNPAVRQIALQPFDRRAAECKLQKSELAEMAESLKIAQVSVGDLRTGKVEPLEVVEFSETGEVLL